MKKQIIFAIITCLIIILGVAGFILYSNYKHEASLIKYKDSKLTADEKKVFEDKLARDETTLSKKDLSSQERYDWLLDQGDNLYGLGRLADAEDAFQEAMELKPDMLAAYVRLFNVQVDRTNYKGAIKNIKKALDLRLENPDLWKKYIQLEIDKFNATNEQIKSLYSDALLNAKSNIDILTSYAAWLEKVGDLQKAKEYWQQAITINPDGKPIYQAEIDRLEKLIKN